MKCITLSHHDSLPVYYARSCFYSLLTQSFATLYMLLGYFNADKVYADDYLCCHNFVSFFFLFGSISLNFQV